MEVRPIDGNKLIELFRPYLHTNEAIPADVVIEDIRSMPTLIQQNEPLTLEQLREMGGKPYWHVGLQEDSKAPHWVILDPFFAKHIENYGYGERWLAYRRPPEGEVDGK